MNKEQAIKKVADLEKELELLKNIINEPENVRWKPEKGEKYWMLENSGDINIFNWVGDPVDMFCYSIGNCFKTEAEAIEYKEKLLFNQEVLDFIARENGDWRADFNDNHLNFVIELNSNILLIRNYLTMQSTSLNKYFKSAEIGEKIIAKFDNEKLKRYFI